VCSPGIRIRRIERIPTAAEGRDVPGGAATDVHSADERIVVDALRLARLRFLNAVAVDG
jgi:hypothetical protein